MINTKIQGIHYNISKQTEDFINKKIEKIEQHVQHSIENLKITINKEHESFKINIHLHFKWGKIIHISENNTELYPAIDKIFHKLHHIAEKEKNKIEDYK